MIAKALTLGQPGRVTFRKVIVDLPTHCVYELFRGSGGVELGIWEPVDGDTQMLPSSFETGEGELIRHISLEEFRGLSNDP